VFISGNNTHFSQSSTNYVWFEQASATINNIYVLDNTSLVANVTFPEEISSRELDLSIFNLIDGYITLHDAFRVYGNSASQLLSISPSSSSTGQTLNVTVVGSNTHFVQASLTSLNFGFSQASSTVVNSLDIIDETSLGANITIPENVFSGYYDVELFNAVDGFLRLEDAFYVNGITRPELVSNSPQFALTGQTLNVTIFGSNTHFTQGSSTIGFMFSQGSGTLNVNSYDILDDNRLYVNVTVPSNSQDGEYKICVYNTFDGIMFLYDAFIVHPSSVELQTMEKMFDIYPNPVSEEITIRSTVEVFEPYLVEIYNLQGKLMRSDFMNYDALTFNVEDFPSGLYIVKASTNGKTISGKFIKQ
jgi:hypothetical protein